MIELLLQRRITMKRIKCPKCELNYMLEGQEYCDVCKAELKKAPPLIFAVDEADEQELMELCPKCHQNYLKPGEEICAQCAKNNHYDESEAMEDDSWKEYLDEETPEDEEENSEEMLSLAKLAEEEGDSLFDDEEEEEQIEETISSEPDDFDYGNIDASDFEEEEEEEEEDEDEEDDF